METTVPLLLFADDAPHRRAVTKIFLKWIEQSDDRVHVSSLLEEEIAHAPPSVAATLISQLQRLPLIMLEAPPEALRLTDRYLAAGVAPPEFKCDLLHVAIAVCHELDIVLSWNARSIANIYRVARICEVNARLGLPPIRVHTPEVAMSL
ncbi:MAG TPA: hypothetical protein VL486_13320 [Verrucomicrobiae bacterium]|nr:hypothetical protein [Verrucomicrobiae bacterium]